jgi:hypothetical protein
MQRLQHSTTRDWMEMIRIRMDHSLRTGVEAKIMGHLAEVQRSHDPPRVSVRRHLTVYNDLMIVLYWDAEPQAAGSSLAYSLCREFESYGLVDHTVWGADGFTSRCRPRSRDDLATHIPTFKEQLP